MRLKGINFYLLGVLLLSGPVTAQNSEDAAIRFGETGFVPSIRIDYGQNDNACLLYTSPSPRDRTRSRMPSSA